MEVRDFAEIEGEFMDRVRQAVWCNMATIDPLDRPRSRVIHPLWEGSVGWITTRRNSHKGKHLAKHPYVSLAYIANVAKSLYVDCRAQWVDDLGTKQRVWSLAATTTPPLGFDPVPIYGRADEPNFGLLQLTPWRVEIYRFPSESLVWRNPASLEH